MTTSGSKGITRWVWNGGALPAGPSWGSWGVAQEKKLMKIYTENMTWSGSGGEIEPSPVIKKCFFPAEK